MCGVWYWLKSAFFMCALCGLVYPSLAFGQGWDISLKFEGARWIGATQSAFETMEPNMSLVISGPEKAFESPEPLSKKMTHDRFILSSDLEPILRYHFNAVTQKMPSMVYVDNTHNLLAISPSVLSSFVDRETSQFNTRMAGMALSINNWTLGGGYLWRQPLFISSSQKTEGFIVGVSYEAKNARYNVSYLISDTQSFRESTRAPQYESVMVSHTWAATEKMHYTATAQYKNYQGVSLRNNEDSWLMTFGLRMVF